MGMWAAAAITAVAALGAEVASAQTGPTLRPAAAPARPAAVPGEIVVAFRSGADGSERAAARSAADVQAKRNLLAKGAQLVKVGTGQTVREAIDELEQRPDVRYAEPNWIYHATSTTPDDPLFGSLWGLHNTGQTVNGHTAGTTDDDIDAPEAWDRNRGRASTVVAVVDSGVAWDHPDLSPNIWSNSGEIADNGIDDDGNGKVDDVRGWDFAYGDNNPWDYDDHGTHVAGTIAARGNNGIGITGVAWQASVMPVQAINANGSGSNANIADAFAYAAANGAKVVNASLGGPAASQAISDAITTHPNTLFVVAAGNDGTNNDTAPTYPCSHTAENLICVAATDNGDNLAGFSNYGALSVDLAAPGVDIDSARPHFTDSFTDDFQTSLSNWTVQSGPWGRVSAIGSIWLADSPSGNYADNADWQIRTTAKVDAGTRTDCALKFTYATFLEDGFDWLYAQSSTDGTTWTDLTRIGDTNGAVQSTALLLGAAGSRYYRFRLTSDDSINKNGVFIDNVRIGCPGGAYGTSDYQFLDGTSMASPHVAGAAAVLFSDAPAATVAEVKAALLSSGDAIAGLSGKTVTGRRLNLSAALTSLVHKADTTTAITAHDPDPSLVGQAVTFKYSVAGNAPGSTPTGNVTVSDGTDSCTATVAAGQCSITFTTSGTKSLTAAYSGDGTYSASPASAVVSHQVNRANTTSTITSDDPDPSVLGQAVTVKYSVAADAPGGGTPTGSVTVSDGSRSCTATVAAGQCAITITAAGSRSLTATYAGDANFNVSPASTSVSHQVDRAGTTSRIIADDPDPSVVGQAVTVRYSVTASAPGSGTPTGDVTVSDGAAFCTATVAAGQCALALTSTGAKSVTVSYAGDAGFSPSASAAEAHTVNKASTETTISTDTPDPSEVGQAVTVHYAVAPIAPGAGTPSGNVTVGDGVDSCTGTVAAGSCDLTLTHVGARPLTARYAGNSDFEPSASAEKPHTVQGTATTTTIDSDAPDGSVVGQAVDVEYSVTAGSVTPSGQVTVSDGDVSCTGTVDAGHCSLTFTSAGAKQLRASYGGSGTFEASTSPVNTHDVDRAGTTTTISMHSPDPSAQGAVVTVHYGVSVDAPGAGTPTGIVTVSDGVSGCTATVAAGACNIVLTTAGSRTLIATYAGDGNFRASRSAGKPHTANPPPVNPPPDNPPSGSGETTSPATPLGPALVHVLEVSQTHAAFRVSGKPRVVQISRRRAPIGTTFNYRLDGAASVRFDFAQPARGRTVKGKCVPAGKRNRRKPRCSLPRGSLTFAGHAALNAVRFNGWLSRTKKLTPGTYTLVITATTPGVGTTSQTLRFKIVR
jgi:subtilisin family serine protease